MKVVKERQAEQWKTERKIDSKWELIQQLIPIGLKAVEEELQREVSSLVGEAHSRKDDRFLKLSPTRPGIDW